MNGNESSGIMRFEDHFPDGMKEDEEHYTAIVFFDNMIRRDFLYILSMMRNGKSCMLCDSIGYNLPENEDEDCEWKYSGCIEVWEVCGSNDHSFLLTFEKFVECLRIAAKIWINNNNVRSSFVIAGIEDNINYIENHYKNYPSDRS